MATAAHLPLQGLLASRSAVETSQNLEMALYQYSRLETGQGWTLEPGNLQDGFWGRYKGISGASPSTFNYWSIPPHDSQVPVSTPGVF